MKARVIIAIGLFILASFLLLFASAKKEVNSENKYDELLLKLEQSQSLVDSGIVEATKKEQSIIQKTVESIIEDKKQLQELTSKAPDTIYITDTIKVIIRDTVIVKEKKGLFGKSKIDTLQ
jgi:hypothetical protein